MLADSEVWRQVAEKISDRREEVLSNMGSGGCISHAEYMRWVGYLQALKEVEQAAKDVYGRMTGSADDEENSVSDHYEN